MGRIAVDEVREAIRSMSNKKAGGTDGSIAEILKCLDDDNLAEIAEVLSNYWENEKVPEELTHAK
eukprot:11773500-Karenia_brevis.AAC.1